jgi:hypothetical protein
MATKGIFMAKPVEHFEYRVKQNDNLSLIISKLYGVTPGNATYTRRLDQILLLNPHIQHPDRIQAGSLLRLSSLAATAHFEQLSCPRPPSVRLPETPFLTAKGEKEPQNFVLRDIPPQDELNFWLLSWLAENSNYLAIPGSVATGGLANLLSPGNINLINNNSDLYAQYKSGALSKGQYDYRRSQNLRQLQRNIGPLERVLFGNQTPQEAIRIARSGAVPSTHNITRHADRLKRLASYGRSGGYLLMGVGITASCMQIGDTNSRLEKNEIFVETVASTGIGLLGGALVGVFLVSNPVGWGTALVLAAGSTAISYSTGVLAKTAYTVSGSQMDFVSGLGIDSVCR